MLQVKHLLAAKAPGIFSIPPEAPVLAAVQMMAERYVGALLVLREDDLVGIVSERDYARKIVLKGRSSGTTPVSEIMSTQLITVTPNDTVEHCMRLCTDCRVRHLPVMNGTQVVGVVSTGDLVKAVISEQIEQIEQLQRYIAG